MAWHLLKSGGEYMEYGAANKEFQIDSETDIQTEPTEFGAIAIGSRAHLAGYTKEWEKGPNGWTDYNPGGYVDPSAVTDAVEDWLDDHPEATTTVQDGSITKAKLNSSLQNTVDEVDALRSAINFEHNSAKADKSLWEMGGLSSSTGATNTGNNRIRTKTFINKCASITPYTGYKCAVYAYKKTDDSFVGVWNGSTYQTGSIAWHTTKVNLIPILSTYKVRLLYAATDDSIVDFSVIETLIIEEYTDTTLTKDGEAADAKKTGEWVIGLNEAVLKASAEVFIEKPALANSGYINAGTGNVTSSSYGKCTDFIDIKKYNRIAWNTVGGNTDVARVAFYNADKTHISALAINDGTSGVVDLTQEAYASVKYVRLSYYNYPSADFTGFNGQLYKENSVVRKTDAVTKLFGIERPINMLIFGDSITDCASITIADDETTAYNMTGMNSYTDAQSQTVYYKMWPKIFGEYIPCAEIRNYARSNASYKDQSVADDPRRSLSYQMTLAINDLDNPNNAFAVDDFVPDCVIFALGTNDGATPNDTPADAYAKIVTDASGIDIDATLTALDKSKFCESVLWAYITARKQFPYALIFCVLPLQRMSDETLGGNMRTYLAEIAQKYGGAVLIDGTFESGIVRENNVISGLGSTLKDGLHPNEKGQNMLARLIIGKYKAYYAPFDYMNP